MLELRASLTYHYCVQACEKHIVGSRFVLQGYNIRNANDEAGVVTQLRDICAQSPYNVTVFHPYFIYFDQVARACYSLP